MLGIFINIITFSCSKTAFTTRVTKIFNGSSNQKAINDIILRNYYERPNSFNGRIVNVGINYEFYFKKNQILQNKCSFSTLAPRNVFAAESHTKKR